MNIVYPSIIEASERYASIDAMKSDTVENGTLVATADYYQSMPGGGGVYKYSSTGRSALAAGVLDEGFYVTGSGADDYFELLDRSIVRLLQFGANPSLVDSYTQTQAAFNTAERLGVAIDGDSLEYTIATEVVCVGSNSHKIKVRNASFVSAGSNQILSCYSGTTRTSTTLTSDKRVGARTITVAAVDGYEVGDTIKLTSDEAWLYDPRGTALLGEVQVIQAIDGLNVTLEAPLFCHYAPSGGEVVTVVVRKPIMVKMSNCHFRHPSLDSNGLVGISHASRSALSRCSFENATTAGLSLGECYDVNTKGTRFSDCWVTGSGTGYGVQANACTFAKFSDINGSGCRRTVDISGGIPSHGCSVEDSFIAGLPGTGSCIGTHGTANMTRFANNTLIGSLAAVQVRSPNTEIVGNRSIGCSNVILHAGGAGIYIDNNRVFGRPRRDNANPNESTASVFYNLSSIEGDTVDLYDDDAALTVITNNIVSGLRTEFIRMGASITAPRNFRIKNNDVSFLNNDGGAETSFIKSNNPALVTLANSVETGNTMMDVAGSYQKLRNVTVDTGTITA